jgi:hypothetical protein
MQLVISLMYRMSEITEMFESRVLKMASLLVYTSLGLVGCASDNSDELKKASEENAKLKQEIQSLKSAIQAEKAVVTPVAYVEEKKTEAPVAADAVYTDIAGTFAESKIKDLVDVKVLKPEGAFEPLKPVTRAEFIQWLVTTNNAIKKDTAGHVRLAEAGEKSSFSDVPATHPQFPYIQGMANAGWSIGYKADKVLTREEMIGVKALFDEPFIPSTDFAPLFTDNDKISKDFWHAMCVERYNDLNWTRVFGKTKVCEPQKPVTRAQAAVCVWQIGYGSGCRSADPPNPS